VPLTAMASRKIIIPSGSFNNGRQIYRQKIPHATNAWSIDLERKLPSKLDASLDSTARIDSSR